MKYLVALAVLALAACGVDGEPVQPAGGVSVSLTPSEGTLEAELGAGQEPLQVGTGL